ncbi:Acyl-coenzyme A thioesterase 13 [Holothuria leucospilota]|uniref:Acyl-coenzyme A thioesterase 13 n=1 Tax=Holothuria leucospilota TaxID=206669 RepID=A0A9Q1H6A5_HOLLE|nr:Acyl-coenzyme A thioesterase 13 [Holothuria leucospilota]
MDLRMPSRGSSLYLTDDDVLRKIRTTEASTDDEVNVVGALPGKVKLGMEVKEEHTNQVGTLHSGLISTLVDSATSLALMTTEKCDSWIYFLSFPHSFIKAAQIGDKITIEAEVLKQGRTLAFTGAKLFNQNGAILATGHHVKHIGP